MSESPIRLNVDITEEHRKKLDKYFGDYGRKKELVFVLLEDLFRIIEVHGVSTVIGALVERAISLKEVCHLKGVNDGDNK